MASPVLLLVNGSSANKLLAVQQLVPYSEPQEKSTVGHPPRTADRKTPILPIGIFAFANVQAIGIFETFLFIPGPFLTCSHLQCANTVRGRALEKLVIRSFAPHRRTCRIIVHYALWITLSWFESMRGRLLTTSELTWIH
jgi:hypothetical protein